jgi:hypothetical protein
LFFKFLHESRKEVFSLVSGFEEKEKKAVFKGTYFKTGVIFTEEYVKRAGNAD